jgi:2-polyprenyl-6-hydroxyphenyl methylase/3-demethylubiquinone-9 3-methyltransferase
MVGRARADGALHALNPVRLAYIRDPRGGAFRPRPRSGSTASPGCASSTSAAAPAFLSRAAGAARRRVTAPIPSENIARRGITRQTGVPSTTATPAEALAEPGERLRRRARHGGGRARHDVGLFVALAAAMVKPGGLMDRRHAQPHLKSFALAIVGAEYILRWLPRGTHQWDKFVTPNELEIALEQSRVAPDRRDRRDLQSPARPLGSSPRTWT